jgi:hypothetical protein
MNVPGMNVTGRRERGARGPITAPGRGQCAAFASLLFVLAAGLVRFPRSSPAWGQQASPVPPASEQAYYAGAYSVVDLPAAELLADFPELRGVELASGQELLPALMGRIGDSAEEAYQRLTSVVADEQITQERCGAKGAPKTRASFRFNYLIQVENKEINPTVEEYRADARMHPVEASAGAEGFPFARNLACQWIILLPGNQSGARFRLVGSQVVDGKMTYVLTFAERPGLAPVTLRFNSRGKSELLLYQGLVWVDGQNYRVAKLRLDLLEPRLDLALEKETTEIRFAAVPILRLAASLWLPLDVTLSVIYDGQQFRNVHHYSNYRLFAVQSTIKY